MFPWAVAREARPAWRHWRPVNGTRPDRHWLMIWAGANNLVIHICESDGITVTTLAAAARGKQFTYPDLFERWARDVAGKICGRKLVELKNCSSIRRLPPMFALAFRALLTRLDETAHGARWAGGLFGLHS